MKHFFFFVLVSAFLLTNALAAFQPISVLPPQGCAMTQIPQLISGDIMIRFNGTRMAFHTRNGPKGDWDLDSSMIFQWTDIREMVRGSSGARPETNAIAQLQQLEHCHCTLSVIRREADGILEEGVETTIQGCLSNPSLVAKAHVTRSNVTFYEPYGPTMEYSSIEYFNYTHPANGIKFGFSVENWTWSSEAAHLNNTYIACGFQLGFNSTKNMTVAMDLTPEAYVLKAQFGIATFELMIELGYLLNGIPTVIAGSQTFAPWVLPEGTGGSLLGVDWPMAFVQPDNRYSLLYPWESIYYDPSLQVFFGDSVVSPTTSSKERKSWVVGVAVAIPIVIVLVIGAILIILFVPAVRKTVLPYRDARRNGATKVPQSDSSVSSSHTSPGQSRDTDGWKAASKPRQS